MPAACNFLQMYAARGSVRLYISSSSLRENISSGAPSMTTSPRCMTIALSACSASSMKWVMRMTVIPCSRLSFLMTDITSRRPFGSSMAVDSSKIMIFGRMASTPAMAMRCFCPPDSLAGVEWRNACMPTASSAKSMRLPISSRGTPMFSGPNATSSSTIDATVWLSGF